MANEASIQGFRRVLADSDKRMAPHGRHGERRREFAGGGGQMDLKWTETVPRLYRDCTDILALRIRREDPDPYRCVCRRLIADAPTSYRNCTVVLPTLYRHRTATVPTSPRNCTDIAPQLYRHRPETVPTSPGRRAGRAVTALYPLCIRSVSAATRSWWSCWQPRRRIWSRPWPRESSSQPRRGLLCMMLMRHRTGAHVAPIWCPSAYQPEPARDPPGTRPEPDRNPTGTRPEPAAAGGGTGGAPGGAEHLQERRDRAPHRGDRARARARAQQGAARFVSFCVGAVARPARRGPFCVDLFLPRSLVRSLVRSRSLRSECKPLQAHVFSYSASSRLWPGHENTHLAAFLGSARSRSRSLGMGGGTCRRRGPRDRMRENRQTTGPVAAALCRSECANQLSFA